MGLTVAGSAFGASVSAPAQPQVNESANGTDAGGFGNQVSSFMQASAADADAAVDQGMWRAEVNSSENKEATLDQRTETLRQRLQRLQNRTAELAEQYENGTGTVAYDARASALRTQIRNVRRAINQTEEVATRTGVNLTRLNDLRSQAANMSGPEVSAMARNITDAPRGPPDGVPAGPPGNATDGPKNPNANESGPPGNATDRPKNPNANESGPPGNATNNTGQGNDGGPPGNAMDTPDRPNMDEPGPPGNATNATAETARLGTGIPSADRLL
jgi:hypothetical protein